MTGRDVCTLTTGSLPLLVSVPHDGRDIPGDIAAGMTPAALELPDTDWHVARLYEFCTELGASLIVASYSRYVVDLNRPASDEALYPGQVGTGVCPERTFAGHAIYAADGVVDEAERKRRIERYWRPYHRRLADELERLRAAHGFALLWDAHSIASEVPSLFEGSLPVLNLGSDNGRACDPHLQAAVARVAERSGYSFVVNGRFRGGYITRHYGRPADGINALQLELAQRGYMAEADGRFDRGAAGALRTTLTDMLETFVDSAFAIRGQNGRRVNRGSGAN